MSMINSTHLKALLITSLGVLLMSLESLFIKLTSISALTFSFYTGLFMVLSINIILLKTEKKEILKTYTVGFIPIVLCGLFFGTSNIFFISAIKTTSVANTVMILSTSPLFSALFAYLFYKEKSTKNIYISSFFIFIGLYIIFSSQLGSADMIGNIYALLCVMLFSLAFVFLSHYKNINRFAVTAFSGFFTAFFSFIFVTDLTIDVHALYILLLAGLFISPISRVFMGIGTKNLPASEVGLLMIIETIMAPIWVWLVLKEIPASSTFTGGSLILFTLFLNSLYVLKINRHKSIKA